MKQFFILLFSLIASSSTIAADPKAAYEMYKQGKAVIIDVREADELKPGMIDGAEWFPMSKLRSNKNWKDEFLKLTQGKLIFLYCRSGNRSEKVRNILSENGISSENIGGFESLKEILPVKVPKGM